MKYSTTTILKRCILCIALISLVLLTIMFYLKSKINSSNLDVKILDNTWTTNSMEIKDNTNEKDITTNDEYPKEQLGKDLSPVDRDKSFDTSFNTSSNILNNTSNNSEEEVKDVMSHSLAREDLKLLPAGTNISVGNIDNNYMDTSFYSQNIDNDIKARINNISYKENNFIDYEDLQYIRVLHYGFDGHIYIGELIVNKLISEDIVDIFKELYINEYPIEKMILMDDYNGDDTASMTDNNTSAFNYRAMVGSNNLSKHSLGLAIDINPLYNPYVKVSNSKTVILPEEGAIYSDRSIPNPYYIVKDDICYNAFIKRGFTWGGSWNSLKDYQHFEKAISN